MFLRSNCNAFEDSIVIYTTKDSVNTKAGLKQNLLFIILNSVKVLKGVYLKHKKDDKAFELIKWSSIFDLDKTSIFGYATYQLSKNKSLKLRKPCELPVNEGCRIIRDYIVSKMASFTNDPFHNFN